MAGIRVVPKSISMSGSIKQGIHGSLVIRGLLKQRLSHTMHRQMQAMLGYELSQYQLNTLIQIVKRKNIKVQAGQRVGVNIRIEVFRSM